VIITITMEHPVRTSSRLFLAIALLVAPVTTGSGQTRRTEPHEPPSRPPAAHAAASLAERLCDAVQAQPARRKGECCGGTVQSLAAVCASELDGALTRGAVTLEAAAVDRCAADVSRRLEGCDWVTPLLPPLPDSCRGIIHGRLKLAQACHSSLECEDGLFCRGVAPGKAGVCAMPSAVQARCENPADNLASFTRADDDGRHPSCAGLCLKGQCIPLSPAGGTCASSATCHPRLQCIAGRCLDQPLPKLGESCAGNTSCGPGTHCDKGRCAALKNAGEVCASPAECRGLACEIAPGEKVGKCVEPCGPTRSIH
jgi:hypothetical protein